MAASHRCHWRAGGLSCCATPNAFPWPITDLSAPYLVALLTPLPFPCLVSLMVWCSKMLPGKQEPPNHSCLQMSGRLSFSPAACVGLLSSGGCGGGPVLPEQGWWGAQPKPHLALEKGFERENPLVSNGIKSHLGWEWQIGEAEQNEKVALITRIPKVISQRNPALTERLCWLERESNRGFHFHVFFLVHKAEITQGIPQPSPTLAHTSCWDVSFAALLCPWTSPWGINPHPPHRHFSPNWKNINQDGFVCEKRQSLAQLWFFCVQRPSFCFPVRERRMIYMVEQHMKTSQGQRLERQILGKFLCETENIKL